MIRTIAIATGLAVLAGGCAAARSTKARSEAGRLAAERIGQRVAWQSGTPEDAEVERRVQSALGGVITPEVAVEIALVRNPGLLARLEDLGIAQADLVAAGLIDNLHIGGGPRFGLTTGSTAWSGDAAINFLQVLLIPLRRKAAKAHLRETTLMVAQAVLELDMQVRQAVYDAIAAERVLELREAAAELAEAAGELATRQAQSGVAGTLNELQQSELLTAEAGARVLLQEAQMHAVETRERLVRMLGVWGDDVDFRLPTLLPAMPAREVELADLERVAVRRRFDLQAQRAELDAILAAVKIARRVPFVAVQVGVLGETDPNDEATLGPFFELELPVFNWGQAEIARAEAMLRQVERRLRGLAVEARSEVRVARAKMVTERMLAEYERDRVVPMRKRMVALGQERYDAMLIGVYELIRLKQHELEARAELVGHLQAYWRARAELELAIGGRLDAMSPRGRSDANP